MSDQAAPRLRYVSPAAEAAALRAENDRLRSIFGEMLRDLHSELDWLARVAMRGLETDFARRNKVYICSCLDALREPKPELPAPLFQLSRQARGGGAVNNVGAAVPPEADPPPLSAFEADRGRA